MQNCDPPGLEIQKLIKTAKAAFELDPYQRFKCHLPRIWVDIGGSANRPADVMPCDFQVWVSKGDKVHGTPSRDASYRGQCTASSDRQSA